MSAQNEIQNTLLNLFKKIFKQITLPRNVITQESIRHNVRNG